MAMKISCAFFAVLCILVPLASAVSTPFQYCNKKANYIVKVNGLDIDPYPITRSKETFAISATTAEPISGGKLVVDVTYIWFHVHSEEHDLCEETSCPVAAGDFIVSHTQELPGITPPGSYTLKLTIKDGNNKELSCITFDFSIGFFAEETLAVM